MAVHTLNLPPPFFRHSAGFDRLQHPAYTRLKDDGGVNSYPPSNIEQVAEDNLRISMVVAGFGDKDLDVTARENGLVVSGKLPESGNTTYIHRGIRGRAFKRLFELAEHIKVTGASLINGLLQIELAREIPEEKKTRTIAINTRAIPQKKAA